MDAMFENVRWKELAALEEDQGDGLWATHEGTLEFAPGVSLRCYQLNDGQRVLDADDVTRFFGGRLQEAEK